MSIKLTDTQLVLLGAAAQRKDLCLVAAPTLKGATAQKVESKLISAGFVKEVKAKASDPTWRRDKESGASYALKLTAAGAKAIAVDDAAGPEYGGEKGDAPANDPIVDQETWDRVQLLLAEHAQRTAGNCQNSDALTGERIRDKIAASKRKGIWMGGVVPLGYRIENRALHVVEEHAVFVRDLYRRYLDIGTVVRLKAILDREDARSPLRTDGTGKTIGGGLISRGHLYKILSNPIYLGRLTHKGQVRDGLHDPIVDQETWDRVRLLLVEHAQRTAGNCQNSDALLAGKLFDDRGNRMSPSHAAKGGRRWRYYVSQAVLQGRKHEAGSVARVPALEIERRVTEAVRAASSASNRQGWRELHQPKASGRGASTDSPAVRSSDYDATLRAAIERVVMSRTTIEIELAEGMASGDQNRILIIPWTPPSPHRRREIIQGEGERPCAMGPMRTEARAVLTDALRDAHHWLDELSISPNQTIESLAVREGKTERWIRRTISLAFLCPALVKAAIAGRLPRGFGVKRLMDLPMAWPDQWLALGLRAPAEP
jgi:site-specific DNA recombinase